MANCPKCNAELKEGARFCHVCGFDMQSIPQQQPTPPVAAAPQQTTQTEINQNTNIMEQNTTPTPQQPTQQPQGFDFNSVPKNSLIAGVIAIVGAIGVFLPWARVSVWGFSSSASGFNAWQGLIAMLALLAIGALHIFGDSIKMDSKTKNQLLSFAPILPALLSFWFLVRILTTAMVNPGIGVFITLFASIAVIVLGMQAAKTTTKTTATTTNTGMPNTPVEGQKPVQQKTMMALVCFFIGGFGIHRMLMGYSNWWLMIITLGGLGIWTLIDFIRILTGDMKMADGRPLI